MGVGASLTVHHPVWMGGVRGAIPCESRGFLEGVNAAQLLSDVTSCLSGGRCHDVVMTGVRGPCEWH